MNDKISIIIPVYNVEPYIRKCLDSVISQTYTNLEILLIDDGSTDISGKICDEYAVKDSRIKVFHKENGGLSSALNIGLKNFSGDYLGFVDSDDWIEPDMYRVLRDAIGGADIAVCSYYKDTPSGSEAIKNTKLIEKPLIPTDDMLTFPLKRDYYLGFCGYVWNKLYNANIVRKSGLFFDEKIKYAMDVLFFETLVSENKLSGVYIDRPLYHYLQREGAITKSESYDVKCDILTVYKWVEELLSEKDKFWAQGFYCYHASVICEMARKKRDAEMFTKMQNEIKAHYSAYKRTNEEFPEKVCRMERLMNAKLVNRCTYDIDRFHEQIADKSIVCFGAFTQFGDWVMQNMNLNDKIVAVIDNDKSIQGGEIEINGRKQTVLSLDDFVKEQLSDFVILINTNRHVDEIVKQLDLSGNFDGVDVYVAELRKYKNIDTLKKLQAEQLSILNKFDEVCKKHNLTYYLTGGTLLGAVRHKGFIPWDDDIDVDMPKKDFDKFVELPADEFGDDFFLHWIMTDSNCVHIPARLKKRNTYRLDWAKGYEYANEMNNAVGICIFRICFSKKERTSANYCLSETDMFWLDIIDKVQRTLYKKADFCMTSPKSIFSALPILTLLKIRELIINDIISAETENFYDKPASEVFGTGVPVEFEGKTYNAPNDWNYWLTKKYGENYMQLPPPEKRLSHCPKKLSFDIKNNIFEDM